MVRDMKRIFILCVLVAACRTESSKETSSSAEPVVSASASVAEVPSEPPSGRHGRHPEMRLVHAAPPQVTGNLPVPVIQRIMHSRLAQIRACYQGVLGKEPTLAGTVVVHFVIDAKGAVTKSERDPATTITNTDVITCTVDAIKSLPFPVPEGGGTVNVTQSFAFQPPGTPPPPGP